jgi:ubiquinone/menaquinone biosynthesis C-methylase UbiE
VERTGRQETERLRRFYDDSAGRYDRWMRSYDRWLLGDARRRLCGRATGRTLEVAVGTGLNLPHYRRGVELTAVDLSSAMLEQASRRAGLLGVQVEFDIADVQALVFADATFDTVVATLMLSSVPDYRRAAAEMRRVLAQGGVLLVLDHVRSPVAAVRWLERLIEPWMVRRTGNHLLRDPADYIEAAGFRIEQCHRSHLGVMEELVAVAG